MSFQLHPDARDELREAVLFYDRTAERFVNAVETAIAAIILRGCLKSPHRCKDCEGRVQTSRVIDPIAFSLMLDRLVKSRLFKRPLRAYLDEKGFKTAMIDDNLAIAGELTWQEVFEPIEGFYEGKADVYPF